MIKWESKSLIIDFQMHQKQRIHNIKINSIILRLLQYTSIFLENDRPPPPSASLVKKTGYGPNGGFVAEIVGRETRACLMIKEN